MYILLTYIKNGVQIFSIQKIHILTTHEYNNRGKVEYPVKQNGVQIIGWPTLCIYLFIYF